MGPEEAVEKSREALRWLTSILGLILVVLFLLGVFDVGLQVYQLLISGNFTDPRNVVGILDIALLLLLVLEVFRDLESYIEGKNLLPVIVEIGIIAVIRNIITFKVSTGATPREELIFSGSSLLLLLGLFTGYAMLGKYGEA